MPWRNRPGRYGRVARANHWISAILIVGLGASGWWMVGLGYYDPWYHRAPDLHKQFGMLALALALLRVGWMGVDRLPPLPTSLAPVQRRLARTMHGTLLVLLIAVPASGYLMVTAAGDPVEVLGLEFPAIAAGRIEVRDAAIAIHTWGSYALLALAAGHALVAIKHRLVDRDTVLQRML